MGNQESARVREIEAQLVLANARFRQISKIYDQVNRQRNALNGEIKRLIDERDAIRQGQLVFHAVQEAG